MKVAILGFGTVGSGVYEVLRMNAELIAQRAGEPLEIGYVLDLRDFPGNPVSEVLTHNFDDITADPEVKVIAEAMGGIEPAYTYTRKALERGISVCTSNKALVSCKGAELLEIAAAHGASYMFEASVGGGIPVLRSLTGAITGDDIVKLCSIVNGTTNFILTGMRDRGMSFEAALAEAQAKGFAERDPSADIEGLDAARKTAILASLAEGKQVDCEDISTEGITRITPIDIAYAEKLGGAVKLISLVQRENGKLFAIVAPFIIGRDCQLYNVNGVYNALLVTGNAVGEVMYYGSGAGKLPTASAIVGDMVAEARRSDAPIIWSREKKQVEPAGSLVTRFLVRVPDAEAERARSLFEGAEEITGIAVGETAFLTGSMSSDDFAAKTEGLSVIARLRADI